MCPLRSGALRTVTRWWTRACDEKTLPSRHHIDLNEIRRVLDRVWLVEYVVEEEAYRYRLAGEHINATFGFSLRGKYLQDVIEPHMLPTVMHRFDHVLRGPGAVHATGRVYSRVDWHREGERLILPLADDERTPTHLFGVTDYWSSNVENTNAPSPPEWMEENFLSLDEVRRWRQALAADPVR
jgi:hypothetical protein